MKPVAYLAGPMMGKPYYNAPEFNRVRDEWLRNGYNVISPVDMDIAIGFDAMMLPEDTDWNSYHGAFSLRDAIKRDVEAICKSNGIIMLPGWQDSRGATVEHSIAHWLGLPIIYVDTNGRING